MGISTNRITEILRGRRNVSADTALRLERALGTPAEQWLRLQSIYELRTAEIEEAESLKKVRRITTVEAAEVKEARGAPKAKRPAKKRRAKKAAKKVRRSR
jgi:plasmid maintenance system antidote protein VapI